MLDNKYSRWYFSIIESRKENPPLEGEVHHIIPSSIGGFDYKSNLVKLTYREHFICHLLLTKMTEGAERTKMAYALKFMTAKSSRQNRYQITGRSFETVKKLFAEARRNSVHTPAARAKTSISMQGNKNKLGKIHSAETNSKISAATKGCTKLTNKSGKRKYVNPALVDEYLKDGWIRAWV
jgi:hypothetical protein